jgi:hypothetical protein
MGRSEEAVMFFFGHIPRYRYDNHLERLTSPKLIICLVKGPDHEDLTVFRTLCSCIIARALPESVIVDTGLV